MQRARSQLDGWICGRRRLLLSVRASKHDDAFFELHPLKVKQNDFEVFAVIVRSMRKKEHLSSDGFERLVRLAYGMNANGKQRSRSIEQALAGSSETVREAP